MPHNARLTATRVAPPLLTLALGMPSLTTDLVRYGVTADEAHRFGLPCGGTIELVLEFAISLETLCCLVERLQEGKLVCRSVRLLDGRVHLDYPTVSEPLSFDGKTLTITHGPAFRMLLIGAGALAEYVSTMALFNGFKIAVSDPRVEYMESWSVAGVERLTYMPDDAVTAFRPDHRTCILALSHDPKLDDLALLEALRSPAFFIGAIGSRSTSKARRERSMTYFGETQESLSRLRGPVGIYIGSKTPAEIAVSIMAEVIAAKNDVRLCDGSSVARAKDQLDVTERPADVAKFISHLCPTPG